MSSSSTPNTEADRLSAAFGIYRLVFQAQRALIPSSNNNAAQPATNSSSSSTAAPRSPSPLTSTVGDSSHARSASLRGPGEATAETRRRFSLRVSSNKSSTPGRASPPQKPSPPASPEPVRARGASLTSAALRPFRTLRRKLVGTKRAIESLNDAPPSPIEEALPDVSGMKLSGSTEDAPEQAAPTASSSSPSPSASAISLTVPAPAPLKPVQNSRRKLLWVDNKKKQSTDHIRSGYLFSQLYQGPKEQARTFFVTLTKERLTLSLSDAANVLPIAAILLTELNDVQTTEVSLGGPGTTLKEKSCTLYSHTLPFLMFSGPVAEIDAWASAIQNAMKEAFDRLISAAVPKVRSPDHRRASSLKDQYQIQGNKGIGGAAFVKNAVSRESGRPVIVKFVNKALSEVGPDGLPAEVSTLLSTKHANIVEVKEVYESEDYFIIVMDKFGEGSDLFDYIQNAERLPEDEARNIFVQVLNAVSHLAENNIVHGDIKDQNNIIDGQTGRIKLIDFGSNKRFTSQDNFEKYTGTPQMACPEAVSNQPFNPIRQELWSLGVLLYILLTGDYPFETGEDIREGNIKRIPDEILLQVSEDSLDVIERLLQPDPMAQMTLEQLKAHRWLRQASVGVV